MLIYVYVCEHPPWNIKQQAYNSYICKNLTLQLDLHSLCFRLFYVVQKYNLWYMSKLWKNNTMDTFSALKIDLNRVCYTNNRDPRTTKCTDFVWLQIMMVRKYEMNETFRIERDLPCFVYCCWCIFSRYIILHEHIHCMSLYERC